MKHPKRIIIFGTSGGAIDVLDTINELNTREGKIHYECVGFLDDDKKKIGLTFGGVKVLGSLINAIEYEDAFFINAIGSEKNYWNRKAIIDSAGIPLDRYITIIHPTAFVSKTAKLGVGTVLLQHVTVASNVSIGNHVVVLPNSIVSHDVEVGDYTCISGGASISGRVRIGQSCYVGTNASIIGDTRIGDYSLIGMGSVVLADVESKKIVVGNPARFLRDVEFKRK